MIDLNKNIVILTGAGISAESGIRTFRDNNGLWEEHRIEDVATPEAFARNPELVHRFYNARRAQLKDPRVRPNAAHVALAELESRWRGRFLLVSQNVDDLHQRAGSCKILSMHGQLNSALCTTCEVRLQWQDDLSPAT
ncbi:MAG: NAD-dependent protein deacylase, partial [Bdellovibrionaceae bacterium]|nr:NAD-dependent protein deacylase [Pseudobdellovibrionaceae bacterium]